MKLIQLTQSISLALVASSSTQAAEFIVTTTGDSGGGSATEIATGVFEVDTLRSAIQLADDETQFSGADTIFFASGLLNESETSINFNAVGDTFERFGLVSDSALGINSEISITGPSAHDLILQANDVRHFQVNSGGQLNLSHVILSGGRTPDNLAGLGGSIITLSGGGLSLNNSTVSNNQARNGGALYSSVGSLPINISETVFTENAAVGSISCGGAIFHGSDELLTISHSRFTNNRADYDGGGISVQGPVTVSASSFELNTARLRGGAIGIINGGMLKMVNSTVSYNTATEAIGGGIQSFIYTINGNNQSVIINSTISHNQSNIDESINSIAINRGDGINFETSGGGLSANYADAFLIHNSLITNNTELMEQIPDDVAAQLDAASSHNLISAGDFVLGISDGINGNQIGTSDAPIDAEIGALTNNGGFSLTHVLNRNSPAIDAGNNVFCELVDQRGRVRPQDGDEDGSVVCDIGAVELGDVTDLIFNDEFEGPS